MFEVRDLTTRYGAVTALDGRTACLLGNHGAVAIGATLAEHAPHTTDPTELARRVRMALSPAIVQQLFSALVTQCAGQAAHAVGHVRQIMRQAKGVVGFKLGHRGLGATRQRIDLVRRGIAVLAEMRIGLLAGAADGFVDVLLDVVQGFFRSSLVCVTALSLGVVVRDSHVCPSPP